MFWIHHYQLFFLLQTDERLVATDRMNFVDFQTDMVRLAKQIAITGNDMVVKAASNPAEVGALANNLTKDYVHLAHESRGAIATSHSMEVSRYHGWVKNTEPYYDCCIKPVWEDCNLIVTVHHHIILLCRLAIGCGQLSRSWVPHVSHWYKMLETCSLIQQTPSRRET